MTNPFATLTRWVQTHKAAAAGIGLGGAAVLALATRRGSSSSDSSSSQPADVSTLGTVPTDTAGLAAQVLGQVQPQLDNLAGQVGNLTPGNTTYDVLSKQLAAQAATNHAQAVALNKLQHQSTFDARVRNYMAHGYTQANAITAALKTNPKK